MSGYLRSIKMTSCEHLNPLLDTLIDCGDGFHDTSDWIEPGWKDSPSCIDRINIAAAEAAKAISAERDKLRADLAQEKANVLHFEAQNMRFAADLEKLEAERDELRHFAVKQTDAGLWWMKRKLEVDDKLAIAVKALEEIEQAGTTEMGWYERRARKAPAEITSHT